MECGCNTSKCYTKNPDGDSPSASDTDEDDSGREEENEKKFGSHEHLEGVDVLGESEESDYSVHSVVDRDVDFSDDSVLDDEDDEIC